MVIVKNNVLAQVLKYLLIYKDVFHYIAIMIVLGVDVTRKLLYIIMVAGILIVFITTLLLYGLYQASLIKLEVKGLYIDDSNGYPSVIVDFTTNKYDFVFKLFDERGELIDMKTPIEGATRVSLSLTGLNPYITIIEPKTYVLIAFHGDQEVYSKTITISGAALRAELLECNVEVSTSGVELSSLIIIVENTGDVPIYFCNIVSCDIACISNIACTPPLEIYVNGEKALFSLSDEILVIRPGEIKVARLNLSPITIKKSVVDVEIIIGEIKETLTFTLEEISKPK